MVALPILGWFNVSFSFFCLFNRSLFVSILLSNKNVQPVYHFKVCNFFCYMKYFVSAFQFPSLGKVFVFTGSQVCKQFVNEKYV